MWAPGAAPTRRLVAVGADSQAPQGELEQPKLATAERRAEPAALVGREHELAEIDRLLSEDGRGAGGVLLEGPAGIGKTSVWLAALEAERSRGVRAFVSRPSGDESPLGFAGLADLLEGVVIDGLSGRKRHALEAVLFLRDAEPDGDPRVVYAAVLDLLRELAGAGPVLIAIDDVPWLDAESAAALAFAARRLGTAPVRFLLAARTPSSDGGRLVPALSVERVTIGPLSVGAVGRIVHERLDLRLPRPLIRRVHEVAAGNPLFALELAREIAARGLPLAPAGEVPLPDRVEELLADRVADLDTPVRRTLLAVALSSDPSIEELATVVGDEALEDAVAAGIVSVERDRVRPAHPLLGEVAKARAHPRIRRELHLELAAASPNEERRALHLARAASRPDGALAATVAAAAAHASGRGALTSATELSELALALTPANDPARPQRLIDAARFNDTAGRIKRSGELLRLVLDELPAGEMRAIALLLLASVTYPSVEESRALFDRAIEEAPPRSVLRARALSLRALFDAAEPVERLEQAELLAAEGVRVARASSSPAAAVEAHAILAWIRSMRGLATEDLAAPQVHAGATADLAPYANVRHSPERSLGLRQLWRGEVDAARRTFEATLAVAEERGQTEGYVALRLQICELELRVGRWDRVSALLDEWMHEYDELADSDTALVRCRALLAFGRGDPASAISLAEQALALAQAGGIGRWQRLEALRARGVAALLAGDPETAVECLHSVWEHTQAVGVEDPGVFPVAPELVMALTATGAVADAGTVTDRLLELAARQRHPWGLAAGARARGLVLLAERDDAAAAEALAEAAERFESLGMPFPAARSLVSLGMALRRGRQLRQARASLERAMAIFEELGSPGWVAWARTELGRIGGRRAAGSDELTPTERRVAELVAEGRTNKQVAAELVITVGVVEAHLTRIFNKLGVHSRTELARRLANPG